MPTKQANANFKVPLQQRSRATLDRIFAATEQLLKHRQFDEISIAEIAKVAGCGVGTVYGRFENKGALLAALVQRITKDTFDRQTEFLESRDWSKVSFQKRAEQLVAHIVTGYKKNGAVLRELVGRLHQNGEGAVSLPRNQTTQVFDKHVTFLLDGLSVSRQAKARKIVGLAVVSMVTTLQNRILQSETSPVDRSFSEAFLKSELPKMLVAYVTSQIEPN